ncbi:hypothetical protein KDW96_18905 [Pseudomonas benzenivorans]|uniref:Secreted protein n=2 Tax=Pseudomonas benzenivorans TaxID=556533 RepID=A0ABY5HDA2_9PSED|nr:hypothetical protein KDW96_18905 [Pseudomonas benzenivorans]
MACVACCLAAVLAWPALAEQQAGQTLRVIPKVYISPGASGSIGSSERFERHDLYGGQQLPGVSRIETGYGSQSHEVRGGIQQSVEYPGGYRVEQLPGQSGYSRERTR